MAGNGFEPVKKPGPKGVWPLNLASAKTPATSSIVRWLRQMTAKYCPSLLSVPPFSAGRLQQLIDAVTSRHRAAHSIAHTDTCPALGYGSSPVVVGVVVAVASVRRRRWWATRGGWKQPAAASTAHRPRWDFLPLCEGLPAWERAQPSSRRTRERESHR